MFGKEMQDPVAGTATVVSYQDTPFNNEFDMTIKAQLVVEGEGLPATHIELNMSIPKSQLPLAPNTAYQVHIDRANPKHITFDQEDEQQTAADGAAAAEALAAQMRAQSPDGAAPGAGPTTPGAAGAAGAAIPGLAGLGNMAGANVQIVGAANPEQAAAAMAKAEQALGVDLNGDGQVGGAATAPAAAAQPTPAAGGDDTVDKLERLAKLHADGALTDAEFASEKQKILGAS